MQTSKRQRIAKGSLNFLVLWAVATLINSYLDYRSQEPVEGAADWQRVFWVGIVAMLVFINYLVVSAWPTTARWVYFWIVASLLMLAGVTGMNQESVGPSVLTAGEFMTLCVLAALLCGPLLYMRFFPPKSKLAPPPRRRS